VRVVRADFPVANMADIWLAKLGQEQRVPFWAIPRAKGWLTELPSGVPDSIFEHSRNQKGSARDTGTVQTKTVQEMCPWSFHEKPKGQRRAAFLVPTTHRPELLKAVLASLKAQQVPPGWDVEILVAGRGNDPGRAVAEAAGVVYVPVKVPYPGSKLNAAAAHTTADLFLAADDDDIQSPLRLANTIAAYERGAQWISCSSVWFCDRLRKKLSWWTGPSYLIGTTTAMSAELFEAVGGWPGVSKGKEDLLSSRIEQVSPGLVCEDLGSSVGLGTVCLQHPQNIWKRPFPDPGTATQKGLFHIVGMDFSELPEHALVLLGGLDGEG